MEKRAKNGIPIRTGLAVLVMATALPFLAYIAYHAYSEAQIASEDASAEALRAAHATATEAEDTLNRARQLLSVLAKRPNIKSLDPTKCAPIFGAFGELYPEYTNLLTVNRNGDRVCSAVAPAPGAPAKVDSKPYLSETLSARAFTVAPVIRGAFTGRWIAIAAHPILNEGGEAAGVVAVAIDLAKLPLARRPAQLPPQAEARVVDARGTVIASSDEKRIGLNIAEVPWFKLLEAGHARTGYAADNNGIERMYGIVPIEGTNWHSAVGIPAAAIYGPLRQHVVESVAVSLAVLLLAAALAYLIARRTARPVEAIAAAAREATQFPASRELVTPDLSSAPREIQMLAGDLRVMLEARADAEHEMRKSEAGLRRAQIMARLAHVITRPDGSFESWSESLPQMIGVQPAAMPRSTLAWLALVHPDDRARFRAQAIEAGRTRTRGEFEYRFRHGDGSWIHITQVSEPVDGTLDASGNLRWFGTLRDVTEQKLAAQELHERQQRLIGIVGSAMDAIVTIDEAKRIVQVNPAAEQMFGYTSAELLGCSIDLLMPERFRADHAAHIAAFGKAGITTRRMGALRGVSGLRKSGEEFPIEASISKDGSTGRLLFTAILRDITESRRAEQVLALEHSVARHLAEATGASNGLRAVMRLVCESEDWDNAIYWRVDKAAQLLRFADGWSRQDAECNGVAEGLREVVLGPRVGLAGSVWQSGQPLWVPNIDEDARTFRTSLFRAVRGAFVFPVSAEGEIVGVLVFSSREIRQPDERLLAAVRVIGDQIGQFLQRKEADERIRRLNRVYAVLSGINALIVRVQDRGELFREACRIAVEAGEFSAAWMGAFDGRAREIVPVASHGMPANYMETIRESLSQARSGGGGIAGQAIREKQSVVSNDVAQDARVLIAAQTLGLGTRALAVLPFIVAGEVVGVLSLHAREPGFFDEEEMKLLHELAGDIAFAIDHIEKASRLDYLAYYDSLTGLANRSLFHERLTQHIHAAETSEGKLAVLMADVERFRLVNDSLGRQAGDALLKQIAERLSGAVDQTELARIGSDQFAIVLQEVKGRSEIGRTIEEIWRSCLDEPFKLSGTEIRVAMRGGIALFPNDGTSADALFRNAEAAWKKARQTGDRYLFHAAEMTARVAETLALETKLRQAVDKEEFVLHYQPKADLETRSITGVEALIRWNSPERGLVPPGLFIPLLEETGLILPVGAWALRRAALDHSHLQQQGVAAPRIAVNVSSIQLRQRDFVETVKAAIAGGVNPTAIDIEITESLLMEDVKGNIEKLKALRDLGMKISIDDFGTGYSSLGYLAKLPVHTLKIDRSFIITMLNEPGTMTLVSTMISLAHSLKLTVVAEGVEKEEQATILRLLRCDEMQGYLFSKPVPLDALIPLLRGTK